MAADLPHRRTHPLSPALLPHGCPHPGIRRSGGRWWQSREPAARSYELQQREISRIDAQYQRLAADAEEYRRVTDERLDTLSKTVADLEGAVDRSERRFWAAIGYPTVGRRAVGHRTRPPPSRSAEELRDYLQIYTSTPALVLVSPSRARGRAFVFYGPPSPEPPPSSAGHDRAVSRRPVRAEAADPLDRVARFLCELVDRSPVGVLLDEGCGTGDQRATGSGAGWAQ